MRVITILLALMTLTGCLKNIEYVAHREDKHSTETTGVLRIAKEQKVKVFRDPGETDKKVEVGNLKVNPNDIFVTEQTYLKMKNTIKEYKELKIKNDKIITNLTKLLSEGKITQEIYNQILEIKETN